MNNLMSFGTHSLWKKRFVDIMNIQPKDNIIDVGTGTGDIIKFIRQYNEQFTYKIDGTDIIVYDYQTIDYYNQDFNLRLCVDEEEDDDMIMLGVNQVLLVESDGQKSIMEYNNISGSMNNAPITINNPYLSSLAS